MEHRHSSSGGYAESPPETQIWTEEEQRKRKKTFTLDFPSGIEVDHNHLLNRSGEVQTVDSADVSPTPSHRHRPRTKLSAGRTTYRNNKKRDAVQSPLSTLSRSPQRDEWVREPIDDPVQIPTSDDSSCSHHYHMHHFHHHSHTQDGGRHRRTRESPRRKTNSYVSARRRSNEVNYN